MLSPDLVIVAVSDAYLAATMTQRIAITGRPLFEIFPDNPHDKHATGVSNLRASLAYVITQGKPHTMAIQKYDIRRPDGSYEVRYWSPINSPVFNSENKLLYILHTVTDVTESQQTEHKLRKSEMGYALLVNSVKDYAIFMIDLDGCVASWNSGAQKIKGYTPAEIIGQPIDIFYTEEAKKSGEPVRNLLIAKEKGSYETEGWRLRKNGMLFWANIVFTALRDEQDELYGYSKITRDITDKKKWQEELELLSRQINQSNDAIFTTDAERKIKSWNKGAEKLYGYTIEEVLGKDSHMLLRSALTPEEVDLLIKEIALKDYWSGELRRKRKDDRDIYVLSSVTTLRDSTGIINGYVAVSFDITEQKKLRDQVNHLASIVQYSSEAIFSRGMDQQIISWNKGAVNLFGYSEAEAIGKQARELGIIKLSEEEIAVIEKQAAEADGWTSERQFFHRTGAPFYGSVAANAVRNEQNVITSIVFIIKDITLRKQLEEHLKNSNEQLEEKVKERTEAIRQSEKKYVHLFDNNPVPLWVIDTLNFRFLAVNEMAIRHYGYSRKEFLSMTALDIRPASELQRFIQLDRNNPVAVSSHNKGIWQHIKKDGSLIYVEIIAHEITFDGQPARIILANDITLRKKIEDKLQASETRFRALIENNTDMITLMDHSFNVIYRSPASARITGWTNEDMMGIPATRNIHPDDQEYAASIVRAVMESPGKSQFTKFRMRHKNGHYLWIEGTLTNLLSNLSVEAIVFNFRDITARVEAEQQIIRSEENLAAIFDNTSEAFVLLDADGTIKAFNNKASERVLLNADTPIIINKSIFNYIDKSRSTFFKEVMAKVLGGEEIHYDRKYISKSGVENWVYFTYNPVWKNNFISGICITARDITERKKAEADLQISFEEKQLLAERLSVILNTLPANIALLNSKGIVVDVNKAWKQFAISNGNKNENYGIGENYIHVSKSANKKDAKDGMAVVKGITAVLQNKLDHFVYEYPCHSPQQQRWFRMIVTPLHEKNYSGAVVMHIDISEVRRLEEERLQLKTIEQQNITRAMLRAQERERHNIGIELHDNVNQILVGTNLMLSHAIDEKGDVKKFIGTAMGYLKDAINENRKIAHVFVSPDEKQNFLEQLQMLYCSMLEMSGIQVQVINNGFDVELLDHERKINIYRIIQEQCTNIVKYAKASQVQIELSINQQIFRCCISDNGIGMDNTQLKKGIGLKNIRDRLRLFNGRSNIITAPGEGFTIEILLPLTST